MCPSRLARMLDRGSTVGALAPTGFSVTAKGDVMDAHPFASLSRALTARATRRTALGGLGAGCLSAGLLASLGRSDASAAPASLPSAQGDAPAWRIAGDVMEACRCNVTCPCNFGSDPTLRPCGSMVGWSIEEGQYGDDRPGRPQSGGLSAYSRATSSPATGRWATTSTTARPPQQVRGAARHLLRPGRRLAGRAGPDGRHAAPLQAGAHPL